MTVDKEIEILETYIKEFQSDEIDFEEKVELLKHLKLSMQLTYNRNFLEYDLFEFEFKAGHSTMIVAYLTQLIQDIKDGKVKPKEFKETPDAVNE